MNLMTRSSKKTPAESSRRGDNLMSFQKEMNNLMKNFFSDWDVDMPRDFGGLYPSLDLKEKNDRYLLDADVPGMSEADIDIDIHNNVLTIKGEKKTEKETKDSDYICVERSRGSFRRDIYLEEEVDQANIKADLKEGVLHIELPKKDLTKSSHKKIPIRH